LRRWTHSPSHVPLGGRVLARRRCYHTCKPSWAKEASEEAEASAEVLITTIKEETSLEEEVKKSRFIAHCVKASSCEDAKVTLLAKLHQEHPKARHICWGWRGRGEVVRCSDDGEPSGTAGQPIVSAIVGEDISDCFVAVVRYFGGIKLGTGGLVRAYGGAARSVLRAASLEQRAPEVSFIITAPISMVGAVYGSLPHGSQRLSELFTEDSVQVRVRIEASELRAIEIRVRDATRGAASIEIVVEADEE
jgi:uncharacterized YigZ family protein